MLLAGAQIVLNLLAVCLLEQHILCRFKAARGTIGVFAADGMLARCLCGLQSWVLVMQFRARRFGFCPKHIVSCTSGGICQVSLVYFAFVVRRPACFTCCCCCSVTVGAALQCPGQSRSCGVDVTAVYCGYCNVTVVKQFPALVRPCTCGLLRQQLSVHSSYPPIYSCVAL
jgi:hypothetical protein